MEEREPPGDALRGLRCLSLRIRPLDDDYDGPRLEADALRRHLLGLDLRNVRRDGVGLVIERLDAQTLARIFRLRLEQIFGCAVWAEPRSRLGKGECTATLDPEAIRRRLAEEGVDFLNVLQCYRCQGFWHTAYNCRRRVRCVRCGGRHVQHQCRRSRENAVCCHCGGPHHAAYRGCPVRERVRRSIRVKFTVTRESMATTTSTKTTKTE